MVLLDPMAGLGTRLRYVLVSSRLLNGESNSQDRDSGPGDWPSNGLEELTVEQ
jgi:hypothetical protein